MEVPAHSPVSSFLTDWMPESPSHGLNSLSGCSSAGADCRQVRPAWCAGAPCRLFCLPGAAAKGSVGKAGQTGWMCGKRDAKYGASQGCRPAQVGAVGTAPSLHRLSSV